MHYYLTTNESRITEIRLTIPYLLLVRQRNLTRIIQFRLRNHTTFTILYINDQEVL